MTSPFRPTLREMASRFGLDPLLVEAVVLQESSGRAHAYRFEPEFWTRYCASNPLYQHEEPRRVAASYGLMQIMYPTAREHGWRGTPEGLFEIGPNVELGCRILRRLLDRFGNDTRKALAAYNGGIGGVGRALPLKYADEVIGRWKRLRA